MRLIKPKKKFGQHFLTDQKISQKIVDLLTLKSYDTIIEVGPGTGALTKNIVKLKCKSYFIDIDKESIKYLKIKYPTISENIYEYNFLNFDINLLASKSVAIIGNFPYNISSQILFSLYDNNFLVNEIVGMFQKEVAERISSPPNSKNYGILSVLMQTYYDIEYKFTVNENSFYPIPRVKSGVLLFKRNKRKKIHCNEKLFKSIIKSTFNKRRKKIKNTLDPSFVNKINSPLLSLRAENLSVEDFIYLTNLIENNLS